MLIDLCAKLVNLIVNNDISPELENMLMDYFDTINCVIGEDIDQVPIIQTQILLLILVDHDLSPRVKRLAETVRLRLINSIIGPMWRHGLMNASYELLTMNKTLGTEMIDYQSFEDGTVTKKFKWSVQPIDVPPDMYVFNDYAQATSNLAQQLKNNQ